MRIEHICLGGALISLGLYLYSLKTEKEKLDKATETEPQETQDKSTQTSQQIGGEIVERSEESKKELAKFFQRIIEEAQERGGKAEETKKFKKSYARFRIEEVKKVEGLYSIILGKPNILAAKIQSLELAEEKNLQSLNLKLGKENPCIYIFMEAVTLSNPEFVLSNLYNKFVISEENYNKLLD
jgi:hypothetical protein